MVKKCVIFGMVAGDRCAGLSISQAADLLGFPHTQQALEFTQNDTEQKHFTACQKK